MPGGRIGTGVGAALLRAGIDEAIRAGRDGMWLRVWERNERAIRFYERFGFNTCGTIEFEMIGGLKTELIMWLGLQRSGAERSARN